MAVNPSPQPTPPKPVTGKYKFISSHPVTYCTKTRVSGVGGLALPVIDCVENKTSIFKEGDVINSTESHISKSSGNWDLEISINRNNLSIPVNLVEKVDDSTIETAYSLVDFPDPSRITTTPDPIITTEVMPRNTIIITSIISALVIIGILKLLKVI